MTAERLSPLGCPARLHPSCLQAHIEPVVAWLDAAVAADPKARILFQCATGDAVAPTLAAAFLMHSTHRHAAAVVLGMQSFRTSIDIPRGYRHALQEYDDALFSTAGGATAAVGGAAAEPAATLSAGGGGGGAARAARASFAATAHLSVSEHAHRIVAVMEPEAAAAVAARTPPTTPESLGSASDDTLRLLHTYGAARIAADMAAPITRVLPHVFLGSVDAALDRGVLRHHNITHIVCLNGHEYARFPLDFEYYVVDGVEDTAGDDLRSHFFGATAFIFHALTTKPTLSTGFRAAQATAAAEASAAAAGGGGGGDAAAVPDDDLLDEEDALDLLPDKANVLVHCRQGISRSAAVLAAFIMKYCGLRARDALHVIQEKRTVANPNDGFREQLLAWERRCFPAPAVPAAAAGGAADAGAPAHAVAHTSDETAAVAAGVAAPAGVDRAAVKRQADLDAEAEEREATALAEALIASLLAKPLAIAPFRALGSAAAPYDALSATAQAAGATKAPTPLRWAAGNFCQYDVHHGHHRYAIPVSIPPALAVADKSPEFAMAHLVAPRLYLGDEDAARDHAFLDGHGITHVVSCVGTYPSGPHATRAGRIIHVHAFDIDDEPDASVLDYFEGCIAFMQAALEGDAAATILVHCQAGISRSASVAAAFIMKTAGLAAHEALALIRRSRTFAGPNKGFLAQLCAYERLLFASPSASAGGAAATA